jgi:4-hydroxy-4-methyl-2-oxoglutarate aldolase
MKNAIIDYIRRNRVSTTEVADCLNKTGVLAGVSALNRGHFCVGGVTWVYAWRESNWTIHEQIINVPDGNVVVMDALECKNRALIGDLVSRYLLLYRQVRAIVVRGNIRDVPRMIKENWPVWCIGANPVGCFNQRPEVHPGADVLAAGNRFKDAIAVCDDCGVVIIEQEQQTSDFLARLEWIEEQEDIWYDCINRRKWSTFDTVCLKKYLHDK